ncbi:hypothetical protein HVZ46_16725 [Citrobacter freundii]|uniref:hypothetical protein n=1 Tax=Citrobacter freundii TaxID=546 RepID=UPI0015EAB6E9|nr:hypothetical protein [Citrobacter freundii]QMD26101.1 hypothetical protein HVZ46_16725 [Citrobacter freundii]
MASFNVRIVFKDRQFSPLMFDKYSMIMFGITNEINDSNSGVRYKLPPDEFILTADVTTREALNKITEFLELHNISSANYSVYITSSNGRVWRGLENTK